MSDHYDVIVIGSGPGGGSVAHRLAPTGKRILLLERGDYLPRSPANWDSQTVFVDGAYQATETWYGADGRSFHPGLHYYVGGNSKVYGAALFRMRERDFDDIVHKDGMSPAWPLKYDAFEPYYAEAERLFHVHGQRGEDPTEPPSSGPFPLSAGFARAARFSACTRAWPRTACIRFICRSESCWTRKTARRRRPASASAATPSTAFPAC